MAEIQTHCSQCRHAAAQSKTRAHVGELASEGHPNARWSRWGCNDEPVMDTFTAEIPNDLAHNLMEGEDEQIGQALIAAGLGNTTAASFIKMGVEASRNGPLSDHRIEQRNADGLKVLQERWGDQVPAKSPPR
jgi:hypothetical protein